MGMAVGATVFDTARYTGRLQEAMHRHNMSVHLCRRHVVKTVLCGTQRANDATITTRLVDIFDRDREFGKYGKGTKKAPGPLFGMAKDKWQALAVGLTWYIENRFIQIV